MPLPSARPPGITGKLVLTGAASLRTGFQIDGTSKRSPEESQAAFDPVRKFSYGGANDSSAAGAAVRKRPTDSHLRPEQTDAPRHPCAKSVTAAVDQNVNGDASASTILGMATAQIVGETHKRFAVRTSFNSTGVVIIDALSPDDLQTASRLYDDLMHLRDSRNGQFAFYRRAETREAFLATLADLRSECLKGMRPMVHIEAHGSREHGLRIGARREHASWAELGDTLSEMNAITQNNLGVVVSACHGFDSIQEMDIDIQKACPLCFLIGPIEGIRAGVIADRMSVFYRTLNGTHCLDDGEATLGPQFQTFMSEKFFCMTFARYMRDHALGQRGHQRVEELLTNAVSAGAVSEAEPEAMRVLRRRFKEIVRRPEKIYYEMSRVFLHGHEAADFNTLRDFLTEIYAT